jgi:hypothetical protein
MSNESNEHKPAKWYVVGNSPLIVSAMCVCGDDECYFTATSYASEWYASRIDGVRSHWYASRIASRGVR